MTKSKKEIFRFSDPHGEVHKWTPETKEYQFIGNFYNFGIGDRDSYPTRIKKIEESGFDVRERE